jgi:hypothetical protein
MYKIIILSISCLCSALAPTSSVAEQTFTSNIEKIEIVNYVSGAAYVMLSGATFSECPVHTNWCAIDFALPSANQMYSAVLAAKLSGKKIGITSNGCWEANYARCWKIHVTE